MKKRNFKSLTNNVIGKQLTFQVVGGITDPNHDNDNPPRNTGGSSSGNNDTRHNSSSQGANSSTGN